MPSHYPSAPTDQGQESPLKPHAAAYYRVATSRQTIASQPYGVHDYAKEHGYELVAEYADEGYSGSLPHRPGLDQLLDAARAPGRSWHILICTDGGRLADTASLAHALRSELGQLGIAIRYVDQHLYDRAAAPHPAPLPKAQQPHMQECLDAVYRMLYEIGLRADAAGLPDPSPTSPEAQIFQPLRDALLADIGKETRQPEQLPEEAP